MDSEKWHAEDFETISKIEKNLILKTELFLFTKLLGYRLHVSGEEFREQYLSITEQVDKRREKRYKSRNGFGEEGSQNQGTRIK